MVPAATSRRQQGCENIEYVIYVFVFWHILEYVIYVFVFWRILEYVIYVFVFWRILEYVIYVFVFWRIPECEISVPGAHVMFMVRGSNNTAFTLHELLT